ncbi:MAG: hypothetical protein AAFQ78_00915 [Bacteroidota bacterium]
MLTHLWSLHCRLRHSEWGHFRYCGTPHGAKLLLNSFYAKSCLVLLLFVGLAGTALGNAKEKPDFAHLVEEIRAQQEEVGEIGYEALEEQLWEYYQQPLNLNSASYETLQSLHILTEVQLDALCRHTAQYGPLLSIYELQAIPTFDLATIRRLAPFVYVTEVTMDPRNQLLWPQLLGKSNSYALLRYGRTLPAKQGYAYDEKRGAAPYAGSSDSFITRLQVRHPRGWGIGLSARKGAGEAFTWDAATQRYGLAPWRCHFLLKDWGRLQTLVVGDYAVGFGQGLVLHAGFGMNKSSETIKVLRINNRGIRPHAALSNTAFKGIATTWRWAVVTLTSYYSIANLDGKVEGEDGAGGQYVRSVYRGGYYRTQGEIAKKAQVNEQVIGSTLVYKGPPRGIEVGLNALYSYYSLPIYPDTERGNPFRFCGQDHANGSLFYRYLWQNLHFFGEGALSKNGGKAALAGVVASLSRYADATVLWRHYGQDFHSLYGKAFRENSTANSNERGLYLGTKLRPWRRWHLDAYYDYFYFPWCWGQSAFGHSWLAKATYQPNRMMLAYFQYKASAKPKKPKKSVDIIRGLRHSYKLRWQWSLSKAITLNSEAQWNSYRCLAAPTTWGCAVVQDVGYKVRRIQLKGRIAWFNIDAHANRMAFYEPNVLYSGFNFPSYQSGQGMRYCVLCCYKPIPALRFAIKYALTWYWDKDCLGNGYEKIEGNFKHEIRAQAMLLF